MLALCKSGESWHDVGMYRVMPCFLAIGLSLCLAISTEAIERDELSIEGFPLLVDTALLPGGEAEELGERTLALLRGDLVRIKLVVPESIVAAWQKITVAIDREHPLTSNMQYHPNPKWLEENGYEAELGKCVHIAKAGLYYQRNHYFDQPWALVHEYAHAYHDQVLGFGHAEIKAAFARAQLEGNYKKVMHKRGHSVKHYALTNHKEYFAEGTEAWFGTNDFYPFVRSELKQHDPRLHQLLASIWSGETSQNTLPKKP